MKNNNYDLPDVSEFNIGFEYEFKIEIGDKEWHKVGYHPSDMAEAERFLNQLHTSQIRVKILDASDIKNEDFKVTGGLMISNGKTYFELPETNIGITLRPQFYEKIFPNAHVYELGDNGIKTTIFNGRIRNINEFRQILDMIRL